MGTTSTQRWVQRLADAGTVVGLCALWLLPADLSGSQMTAAFGLIGLCVGTAQQFRQPTTPGSRRVFVALFALICLGALVVGGDILTMAMTLVGGWTVGLGFAASFDPHDSAPVERSFSGQVIRRG